MKKRPAGTIPVLTGYVGFGVLVGATLYLRHDPFGFGALNAGIFCLMVAAGAMVIVECILQWRYPDTVVGERLRAPTWAALSKAAVDKDFLVKIYGQFLIFGVLWVAYHVFPIYETGKFPDVLALVKPLFPIAISVSVLYLWVVHAMMPDKRDGLWNLGQYCLFFNRRDVDRDKVISCALSWVIKGFFLPLMMTFFLDEWQYMADKDNWMAGLAEYKVSAFFGDMYRFLYFIDLSFAVIGYSVSLRLLSTHTIMPEKTLKGWFVCLMCYAPFWPLISQHYISYWDDITWGSALAGYPVLYTIWGTAVLLVIAVYVYATICFGLRFSNLTHRGIITHGPYAVMRHPAYVCKNLSYWMIEIPFMAASPLMAIKNCAMLVVVNWIYYQRAKCEEAMLSVDPVYREYKEIVKI